MSRFATAIAATVAALAVCGHASAATPVTFNFGGASTTFAAGAPFTQAAQGVTVSALGYSFNGAPAAFQVLADGANASSILGSMTLKSVRREGSGIGVCWPGEAANQCNQVDSDGTNELLRIVISEGMSLATATFDRVDNNDTLKLYGVTVGGVVEHLGYGGIFDGPSTTMGIQGLGGAWMGGTGDDQIYTVSFDTARYKEFWFGNNNDSADGYRLRSVSVAAVPEPGTWALMIGGFGLTGAALRRRRTLAVATA